MGQVFHPTLPTPLHPVVGLGGRVPSAHELGAEGPFPRPSAGPESVESLIDLLGRGRCWPDYQRQFTVSALALSTDATPFTAVQLGEPRGVMTALGTFSGVQISRDTQTWIPLMPGAVLPVPRPDALHVGASGISGGGKRSFYLRRADGQASGTVTLAQWYSAQEGAIAARIVTGGIPETKRVLTPTGVVAVTRQALTTGVGTTFTFNAATVYGIVRAKASNAAVAYLGTTAVTVLVATTRYEMSQADAFPVYGASIGMTGTTGDHLDVFEYS